MQMSILAITEFLDNFVASLSFNGRRRNNDGEHLVIGTTISRSDLSNDAITVQDATIPKDKVKKA